MKALMMAAVQRCYTAVGLLCGERDNRPQVAAFDEMLKMASGSTDLLTALGKLDFNPEWDEPPGRVTSTPYRAPSHTPPG
jgi:hypothetical protein